MRTPREDQAIVIRRVDYGENDVIVELLTRELGRVSLFARGVRKSSKRFVGGLGPFTLLRVAILEPRGDGMGTLSQSEALKFYDGVVTDPLRLMAGSHLMALIREVIPSATGGDPLFSWVLGVLDWMHEANPRPELLAFGMLRADLVLLQDAGLMGALDECARSGAPLEDLENAVFLPTEGIVDARFVRGWVGQTLDKDALRLVGCLLERRLHGDITSRSFTILRRAFYEAWMTTLTKPLKTWDAWDQAMEDALCEAR